MTNEPIQRNIATRKPIVYGSVCSGIEAATAAWHPLGWTPSFFSEIEPFPRAVLQHHYPLVPLHGDFTTIGANDYDPIDLLVGGTPCQSFSIAGLRKGLSDERGNLTLEFVRLAQRLRPRWLLWENVPGVLSSGRGRDFGSFLGALAELGYGFSYRVLDAQYFGVPQRRRRVFVVGYLGDWRPAAAVLFEREGLLRDITPRREAREAATEDVANSVGTCGKGDGSHPIAFAQNSRDEVRLVGGDGSIVGALAAEPGMKQQSYVAHAFKVRGGCEGGGKGYLGQDELAFTVSTGQDQHIAIPINTQIAMRHEALGEGTGPGIGSDGDLAFTLQSAHCHAVGCFKAGQGAKAGGIGFDEHLSPTLGAADSGTQRAPALLNAMQVRRLTPRECERLQGFPDDFSLVPFRGKPAADGPRYKALGNSMAVPCMSWLGRRIQHIDDIITTAA